MDNTFRQLKQELKAKLAADDWQTLLPELASRYEPKQCIGPLFTFLMEMDVVRWRAVTALGVVVDRLFHKSPEDARVIMRRLMWNLNEESGNVAWGAPETMGEIMAVNVKLADEYASILASYMDDSITCGNYLDHPPLRRGVYWGLARLAETRPKRVAPAAAALVRGLEDCEDPVIPGLAALTLARLAEARAFPKEAPDPTSALHELTRGPGGAVELELYRDRELNATTVADLADEALAAFRQAPPAPA